MCYKDKLYLWIGEKRDVVLREREDERSWRKTGRSFIWKKEQHWRRGVLFLCLWTRQRNLSEQRITEGERAKDGEKECEFGGKEGDNGTVHGSTRTQVPWVDARPGSPWSHRLWAPHPWPGISHAALLDPRPPQFSLSLSMSVCVCVSDFWSFSAPNECEYVVSLWMNDD